MPNSKNAPNIHLSSKTGPTELKRFLAHFNYLCTQHEITDPAEKCEGLIPYCTTPVINMIERLPSYVQRNYEELVNDLYYFMEGEDDTYDIGEIIHFTKKWRKKPFDSIRTFKQYHKGFLAHTGKAIGEETIDKKEYNRYFWEGIHSHLRKWIEERLAVLDPNLNTSIPFEMKQVVAAAKAIYPKDQFDRHLDRIDTKLRKDYRPSHIFSESEDDEDRESEDSDEPPRRHSQKNTPFHFPFKPISKTEHVSPKRHDKDEIAKLTEQMNQLKLYLMQKERRPTMNAPQNHRGAFPFNPQPQPPHVRVVRPAYLWDTRGIVYGFAGV